VGAHPFRLASSHPGSERKTGSKGGLDGRVLHRRASGQRAHYVDEIGL
jgi:hypothetical protein